MRKNLFKYIAVVLGAMWAAGFSSCFKGMSDNTSKEPLELSRATVVVGKLAVEDYIGITARTAGWTLTGDEDWCRVDPSSGDVGTTRVKVTFLENTTGETRETTFVITAGDRIKEITVRQLDVEITLPNQNPEYPYNKAIHDEILKEWYYMDEEVEKTAADYNQPYEAFYENYLAFLPGNELDGNTWSTRSERYLYSYITRTDLDEAGLVPLTYGMEFDIADYSVGRVNSVVARVLYVMDRSPAQQVGLKRGDWFYKVNDVRMADYETADGWWQYNKLIDTLVNPIRGESPKLGMLRFEPYAYNLIDQGRSLTVSSARFSGNPILHKSVIPRTEREISTRTGYLVYNSFDPDYENELVGVFEEFRNYEDATGSGLTDLVLDLRYNKTGTVEMAELMANLIVPPSMDGSVFATYEFNKKQSAYNRDAVLSSHPSSVGLTRVYVLTSEHTAGAAELLINAFKGLESAGMTIVMIGDTTEGMNTGMVERVYRTDTYEYRARLVAFRCYNAMGEGDYHWGLSPNGGTLNEWENENIEWSSTWGWKGLSGMTEDKLLLRAMNIIVGNVTMPTGKVTYGQKRQKAGYPREFSVRAEMKTEAVPEE